ncbi:MULTISPECIES: hypothetical protein [Streptomyces]|nr:hypothetical protein [Streptomyces sp. JHD 1]MCX2971191.1 hypothetical protein [Streptomyces sp. JHD 1]
MPRTDADGPAAVAAAACEDRLNRLRGGARRHVEVRDQAPAR